MLGLLTALVALIPTLSPSMRTLPRAGGVAQRRARVPVAV